MRKFSYRNEKKKLITVRINSHCNKKLFLLQWALFLSPLFILNSSFIIHHSSFLIATFASLTNIT